MSSAVQHLGDRASRMTTLELLQRRAAMTPTERRRELLGELHDSGSITIHDADESRYLRLVEDWCGDARVWSVEQAVGLHREEVLWEAIETRAPLRRVVELLGMRIDNGAMPVVDGGEWA